MSPVQGTVSVNPAKASQPGVLAFIEKRDGRVVSFDRTRIENAIAKACEANAEDAAFVSGLVDSMMPELEALAARNENGMLSIEVIQDAVERALMASGRFELAKAYVIYRMDRARERHEKHNALLKQLEERGFRVKKASGELEQFDLAKIEKVFRRVSKGCEKGCDFKVFLQAFRKNIVEDIETKDINRMMIKTAIDLVTVENIGWQTIASRLLSEQLYKQAMRNRKMSFSEIYTPETYLSLFKDHVERGLYYKNFFEYYSEEDIREAGRHLKMSIDEAYEYTTVLSLNKRYLIKQHGAVRELPQEMYMSVALFLAIPEKKEDRLAYALKLYTYCAEQMISLPTPTLLNSRTNYHQLSSCFKLNIDDDLRAIYHGVENVAQISKFGGGVGVYLGNIRAREASIRGVKKASGGVNPWVKVINDTAIAVNQLGARLGAVSVTLDMWHRDIYDYLDLQTETGDIRAKAFDVFPAVSVPDLFMKRVKADAQWTLFDPYEVEKLYGRKLQDTYGEAFERFYEELEQDPRLELKKQVAAKELMKKHLRTVVETGMPYVFFRDTVNKLNPNKHAGMVYSTQLCTEICQNTSPSRFVAEAEGPDGKIHLTYEPGDTVVCNLASINVAKVYDETTVAAVMPVLARALDNVITLNYYPIEEAKRTAMKYRPIGIGYLGLAEYLATRHIAYESQEARDEVRALFERYAFHTYRASVELAKDRGHYQMFPGSEHSKGVLLGRTSEWFSENTARGSAWTALLEDMKVHGTRFGYHTAPAPNTSTAGVVGTTAALLPIYKRFFVENNLSAQTIRVAPKLSESNFTYYKEYVSMDMNDVIDLIAEIYPWVDQSISFEWMINPERTSPQDLYSYYFRAWEKQIKTVYYVRSLSVSAEEKKGVEAPAAVATPTVVTVSAAVATPEAAVAVTETFVAQGPSYQTSVPSPSEMHPEPETVLISTEGKYNVCESCSG